MGLESRGRTRGPGSAHPSSPELLPGRWTRRQRGPSPLPTAALAEGGGHTGRWPDSSPAPPGLGGPAPPWLSPSGEVMGKTRHRRTPSLRSPQLLPAAGGGPGTLGSPPGTQLAPGSWSGAPHIPGVRAGTGHPGSPDPEALICLSARPPPPTPPPAGVSVRKAGPQTPRATGSWAEEGTIKRRGERVNRTPAPSPTPTPHTIPQEVNKKRFVSICPQKIQGFPPAGLLCSPGLFEPRRGGAEGALGWVRGCPGQPLVSS